MPARKPQGLNVRHDTAAEADARAEAESTVTPERKLPESEPAALADHATAAREWRRLMRLYNSLDVDIVSRLDMGMLLDYCILIEQIGELDKLRAEAIADRELGQAILEAYKKQIDDKPDEPFDFKTFVKAQEAVNWALDKVIKIDGRVDRKRALVLQLRQSLYLTPRSRAGVTPPEKPPAEQDNDEMSKLLDEQ
jgi:phage terminase small subunit